MTSHNFRHKRYGIGSFGWKIALALWWGTIAVILELQELPDNSWVFALVLVVFFGPPIALYCWSESHGARQQQRDVDAALDLIKRPLPDARLAGAETIDFDPHYPTASPTGGMVYAIDPGRRLIRMISSNVVDANGRYFDEVGPVTGEIANVELSERPGGRRWMWLLPPRKTDARIRLTVFVHAEDGQELAVPFSFRAGDRAVEGWRRTLERWMQEDRRKTPTPVDACGSLRHPDRDGDGVPR